MNKDQIEQHREFMTAKARELYGMCYDDGYGNGIYDMFQCIMTILHFSIAEHREIFGDRWVDDSLINTISEMDAQEFIDCVNDWVDKKKGEAK